MKNEKAYDNLVYSIVGTILVVGVLIGANACNREVENAVPKTGEKKLNHATSIYEVEFDGQKYIVVDTHRGIGICPKTDGDMQPVRDVLLGFVPGAPDTTDCRPLPQQYLIPGDLPSNMENFLPPKIGKDGLPLDN